MASTCTCTCTPPPNYNSGGRLALLALQVAMVHGLAVFPFRGSRASSPLHAHQNPNRRRPAMVNTAFYQRPFAASVATINGNAVTRIPLLLQQKRRRKKSKFRGTFSIMFPRLQSFQQEHGHCLVPPDYPDAQLYIWTRYLRRNYRHQFTHKVRDKKKSTTTTSSHSHPIMAAAEPGQEQRRARLSESKARLLQSLNFCWNVQEYTWERKRLQLQEFLRHHGHLPSSVENSSLAVWWSNQVRDYRKWLQDLPSPMTPERVEALDQLGVLEDYTSQQQAWAQHYQYLVEYHQVHGHANVPQNYLHPVEITVVVNNGDDEDEEKVEQRMTAFPLGKWCMNQRTARRLWNAFHQEQETSTTAKQKVYKKKNKKASQKMGAKGFITAERIRLLDALDFSWNVKISNWQYMLKRLQAYYKRHGHLKIPTHDVANRDLMNWLIDQRYYYHLQRRQPPLSSPMTGPRVQALEEAVPEFSWKHYNTTNGGPTTQDWSNLFTAIRDKGIVPGMKPKLHWFDGVNPLTMQVKTEWTEQELIDLWNQEEEDEYPGRRNGKWSKQQKEKVRRRRRQAQRSSGE